ncbi:MAG: DNA polymerase I, partial [Bradymonadia bacterium]
ATIVTDVPLEGVPASFTLMPPNPGQLADYFRRLNFRRFLEEFDLTESSEPKTELSSEKYRLVTTFEAMQEVFKQVREHGTLCLDLETTSLDTLEAKIVGLAIAWAPGDAVYMPVGHTLGSQLALNSVLEQLVPLLKEQTIKLYGQNLKYDLKVLANYIDISGINVYRDSMIAAYLIDPGRRQLSLDHLALETFGHTTIKYTDLLKAHGAETFAELSIETAQDYACEDADVALRLGQYFEESLETLGLKALEQEIENPLISVLAKMERHGIRMRSDVLQSQSNELSSRIDSLRSRITSLAGEEFNVDSPKQLSHILFEKLELPEIKKTKTGQSTDSQVLQALVSVHPIAGCILDYRQLVKLKNTYLDTLPGLIAKSTGRIHTQFKQAVTATGRLSSSEPNLQNIPIRTPEGRRVREAFVPADGYTLISADYSQIELRLLAHYSGDEGLIGSFNDGADIHRRTAAQVFGIQADEVSDDQRRQAKSVNFGLMYGMSAFRLSNELGIPQGDARRLIKRYFEQYEGVRRYFESAIGDARDQMKAKTLFGRVRTLPHINSRVFNLRQQSERLAINTPIQGTAADILKTAMLRVQARLEHERVDAKMLLTVHDELVLEAHESEVDQTVEIVRSEMEGAAQLSVPLVVEVGVGASWAQIH